MSDTPATRTLRSVASLTPTEVRRVAVEAGVEPRTAAKYLRGERVVLTCADRIRRALTALGLDHVTRSP